MIHLFLLEPPYEKYKIVKNVKRLILINVKNIFYAPCFT